MEDKHITEQLSQYLDGLLSAEQREEIEIHLKDCNSCAKELTQLSTLFHAFAAEEIKIPSDNVRINFLKALQSEKQETKVGQTYVSKLANGTKPFWTFLRVAASIALLISAFLLGRYQRDSVTDVKMVEKQDPANEPHRETMMALLENTSASKRIQGVNYMYEFENPGEAIVIALIDRMLLDDNTNVRLSAVEALTRFTDSETVRDAFINALKTEKEPGIQILIIQTLVKIQEKSALAPMQRLLEQEDTLPFVKEQLKLLMPSII